MSTARKFQIGKYYQFVGEPMVLKSGEKMTSKVGAVHEALIAYDMEIVHNWMDRQVRRCLYADSLDGTSATFEDIYFYKEGMPRHTWRTIRSYRCYLEAGMFEEVSVER